MKSSCKPYPWLDRYGSHLAERMKSSHNKNNIMPVPYPWLRRRGQQRRVSIRAEIQSSCLPVPHIRLERDGSHPGLRIKSPCMSVPHVRLKRYGTQGDPKRTVQIQTHERFKRTPYIRTRQNQHTVIFQELCESRGGRPGLSVLTSLLVFRGRKAILNHASALVSACP